MARAALLAADPAAARPARAGRTGGQGRRAPPGPGTGVL